MLKNRTFSVIFRLILKKKTLEAVAMATNTQQTESTINYMFLCDNTQTEKV